MRPSRRQIFPDHLPRRQHDVSPAPAMFSQRVLSGMAGATHARACLLEHAAELQAFLDPDSDEALHVEISDAALTRAAAVWRQPQP